MKKQALLFACELSERMRIFCASMAEQKVSDKEISTALTFALIVAMSDILRAAMDDENFDMYVDKFPELLKEFNRRFSREDIDDNITRLLG